MYKHSFKSEYFSRVFLVLIEYIMFKDKLVLSFTKKIVGNQNLYITYTNVDSQWFFEWQLVYPLE